MLADYFSIIESYVLSVSLQKKYNFYLKNTLLDAFRTNSRNIIGRNPSMVIPLLANQDLTPMLFSTQAIFLYSALFNCFTRSRSMTVTIEIRKLRSCPMH